MSPRGESITDEANGRADRPTTHQASAACPVPASRSAARPGHWTSWTCVQTVGRAPALRRPPSLVCWHPGLPSESASALHGQCSMTFSPASSRCAANHLAQVSRQELLQQSFVVCDARGRCDGDEGNTRLPAQQRQTSPNTHVKEGALPHVPWSVEPDRRRRERRGTAPSGDVPPRWPRWHS